MLRKERMQGVNRGDSPSQVMFVAQLFGVAISTQRKIGASRSKSLFAHIFVTLPHLKDPDN